MLHIRAFAGLCKYFAHTSVRFLPSPGPNLPLHQAHGASGIQPRRLEQPAFLSASVKEKPLMFAVIEANGRQLKVKKGDVVSVDRVQGDPGHEVTFERVLLAFNGKDFLLGPALAGKAKVTARVVRQAQRSEEHTS